MRFVDRARPAGRIAAILSTLACALGACTAESTISESVVVERDAVADTVVVRTIGGSRWGEPVRLVEEVRVGLMEGPDPYILGSVLGLAADPRNGTMYVYDGQVPALRAFSLDGEYLRTLGRRGEGPGEYRASDGGLAVLPDGRVVLRDPGNGRIQFYGPDGERAGSWSVRGLPNTHRRLVVDSLGRIYTFIVPNLGADATEWRDAMVRFGRDGVAADTFPAPDPDFTPPRIVARNMLPSGRVGTSSNSIPYAANDYTVFSPLGYWVVGVSTRYAVDLHHSDGRVLRFVREGYEPVSVTRGERTNAEKRATWVMRQRDPDWRWNGPSIPETKPPYRDLLIGEDGRIWVLLHRPGIPIEDVEEPDPGRPPPRRWREPVVFDVFDPDGTYLGQISAPEGFQVRPAPVFRGDLVWAAVEDELDVQRVVRFRIALPGEDG